MAIKRIQSKPDLFVFPDGENEILVGVRKPTVGEMQHIATLRSAYMKTYKADLRDEKEDPSGLSADGDASKMIDLQFYISKTLCCDPGNANIQWFAGDAAEQTALEKQGVEKDLAENVPQEFHAIAFATFSGVPNKYSRKADGVTPLYPTEPESADTDGGDAPLETSESLTTSNSDDKSSPSPSGSESIQSDASENGPTTSS